MARSHRIRYTPEFKAEALSRIQHSDQPIRHIAKELGVTSTTLHRRLAVGGALDDEAPVYAVQGL